MTKKIIVLYNLGTPDSLKIKDIRKYLFEFLMDPCVIDLPFPLRLLLVGGIIVPFRSPKTQKCYEKIWSEGSPLLSISKSQTKKLNQKLSLTSPTTEVLLAMRYGNPNLKNVLNAAIKKINLEIASQQLKKLALVFVPMYPHAALSTTITAERMIHQTTKAITKKLAKKLAITTQIVLPFYQHPKYIDLLAESIAPHLEKIKAHNGHLLFSYHGIPERHLNKTEKLDNPETQHCLQSQNCCSSTYHPNQPAHQTCYRHQTFRTTALITEKLGLHQSNYTHAYQSRLGRDPWLTPYTDKTIESLGKKKLKNLFVICPAFVADNLETLFEIQIENEEIFQEAGGKNLTLIRCLNDRDKFIDLLAQLVN